MIKCRAVETGEVFVTAKGEIIPCCHMYFGGPNLGKEIKEIISRPNFSNIEDSWNSEPFFICKIICDTKSNSPISIKNNFDGQWKNEGANIQ